MSITGRSAVPEAPRSTTPSSVTSSSSRTKSPATPVTRSLGRITRQGKFESIYVINIKLIQTLLH